MASLAIDDVTDDAIDDASDRRCENTSNSSTILCVDSDFALDRPTDVPPV